MLQLPTVEENKHKQKGMQNMETLAQLLIIYVFNYQDCLLVLY